MKKSSRKRTKKRTRIAKKPRFALFCTICVMVISCCIGSITSVRATKTAEVYTLLISPGDTLWEIARSCNTEDRDIRNVVDEIMRLNNMRGTDLKVGDTLTLPIY